MSSSRRQFLKSLAQVGLAASPLLVNPLAGLRAQVTRRPSSTPLDSDSNDQSLDDVNFWEQVRDEFPLRRDRVYFNNATLGPSPNAVLESVIREMREIDLKGEHGNSDATRVALAQFVGALPEEISITHNTTEGINTVAWGLPLKKRDEVILTTHEHVGGALPWLNRARLDQIVIKTFEPARTASDSLKRIQSLITSKTRVIAIPHISCTTGQVFPIEAIVNLARRHGIFVFVDGAHGTGMMPLDLHALGCDFYASCGHKWLCGPKGTGYLFVKKDRLDTLEAKWVGAYSNLSYQMGDGGFGSASHGAHSNSQATRPEMGPLVPNAHRYDFGTQNEALINGMKAAIETFNVIGQDKIYLYGRDLADHLHTELSKRSAEIEVLTPFEKSSRALITTFRFKTHDFKLFAQFASKNGFRIRQVTEAGLNAIRVSTHLYNSAEEVESFVALVDQFTA